jgi:two-component system, NtrC family, nitrogen regulation sensor histidine kinase NtrY
VTLRRRFALYLVVVHLAAAALAVAWLHAKGAWLLLAELLLVCSLAAGFILLRRLFGAFAFTREASQLLADGDFMSRFRPVGQPELDRLIELYNRMSDRLRTERVRLEEQQQFLTRIMAVSPLGIVLLSFDGEVAYVNPSGERLLQQPASQLLGKPLGEVPGALAETLARLADGDSTVVPLWGGRRARCQRGAFVDRGFPRSFMVVEELTEELRQFERAAYGKLIRMMSHEVNNSVGASNSLLHSCLTYAAELPPAHRADFESAISIAIGRTDHLNAFMRTFADVIRLPAPRREPGDVGELLARIERLTRSQREERGIAWRTVVEEPLPPVLMDAVQMEQVLVNVVKNAIEAIGRDGSITVRLGRRDGRPAVVVEDTGPGLSAEARQNLFTPFFSTKEHGQGIGLTLVQEILSQHRFRYSLETPPGGPTEFTIVF